MSEAMKMDILKFVSEHPCCTAREVGIGIGDEGKLHSMELFTMRKTGLIFAHKVEGNAYPVYTVNPDADPEEIRKPSLVYQRKRGNQRNRRLGINQRSIIDLCRERSMSAGDLHRAMPELRRAYLEYTALELVEQGLLEVDDSWGENRYSAAFGDSDEAQKAIDEIVGWSRRLVESDGEGYAYGELRSIFGFDRCL